MWVEQVGNKYRVHAKYKDPLTDEWKKVSVRIDKNTPQQRNKAAKKLDAMIAKNQSIVINKMTFGRLCDLYEIYQSQTLKASTVQRNQSVCRTFKKILGENANVNRLTAGIVKERLMTHTTSPTTYNEYISRFKALMRFGYQNDFVDSVEWLSKLTRMKEKSKREKVEDKYLERSECDQLIDGMKQEDWKNLTRFLILSGLRIGEALALDESDVNLKGRTISVTKTISPTTGMITPPKTETSNRLVYMQDELLAFSRSLIAQNRKKRRILYIDRAPLFFTPTGSHASYDAYRIYLERAALRTIGRKITPHTLRHTHASLMAEAGLDYETISHRLGHSSSRITKDIYIHVTEKREELENEKTKEIRLLS